MSLAANVLTSCFNILVFSNP